MVNVRCALVVWLLLVAAAVPASAQAPIEYRVILMAPEHRVMQVEVTFRELPAAPLQLRMSRTSPGRYALHEFAKNVFDVVVRDGAGRALKPTRPNLHQWDVTGHDGTVVVTYRVYGDRVDGTYLAIDSTHAHINMPAALIWARGLDSRQARVSFVLPPERNWRVATQLLPTDDPFTFTAPNLAYLLDSPTEVSAFTLRTFTVPERPQEAGPTFRIALHHDGTDADADALARDAERIVRETLPIFGEFPRFEGNTYTFLADYVPWASGDGMEHRNSTVLSSAGALRNPGQRPGLLGTVAHEFFHSWNMERIRAAEIEPFDFENANMSRELWLGEGFTSYYTELILARSGLAPLERTLEDLANFVNEVTLSPGRALRSARDMSALAAFVDAAVSVDRTSWPNTFISYYTWGAAIGLGLDLSLRERAGGRTTLDDFMAALWQSFGRPGQAEPGIVKTPYTMAQLEETLASVTGDREFAREFFLKYIEGHDVVDYERLFQSAGFTTRRRDASKATLQGAALSFSGGPGARVQSLVRVDSPMYAAGIAQDDQIVSLDGRPIASDAALQEVLGRRRAGDRVPVRFVRRSGEAVDATIALEADPRIEIVPVEATGGTPTDEQQRFRQTWLGSKVNKVK